MSMPISIYAQRLREASPDSFIFVPATSTPSITLLSVSLSHASMTSLLVTTSSEPSGFLTISQGRFVKRGGANEESLGSAIAEDGMPAPDRRSPEIRTAETARSISLLELQSNIVPQ